MANALIRSRLRSLCFSFPDADVPVVQVSLTSDLHEEAHLRLGEALAPLRYEGILIVGSGSATHSLREMYGPGKTAHQFLYSIS
jgi:4,5-DOPA dioxygenase extradiol